MESTVRAFFNRICLVSLAALTLLVLLALPTLLANVSPPGAAPAPPARFVGRHTAVG